MTAASAASTATSLARDGCGPTRIAQPPGCSRHTVMTWRDRYWARGLAGPTDAHRPSWEIARSHLRLLTLELADRLCCIG